MRRFVPGAVVLVVALLAGCLGGTVQAEVPANDGWVTDLADFLTPQQEQALEALMESYRTGSGNEIALLTVPTLGGRSLERYALEVGRSWGLGERGKNNGALLFLARDERKIRIEVGRGLEGNLTDSICGRVIRDVIAPELKQGRMYEGLRAGIEAMHAAAGGDYGKIPGRSGKRSIKIGLLPLVIAVWMILNLIRRIGRGGGGRGGGGELLAGYLLGSILSGRSRGGSSGGFGGFGGGGGFSGGGSSGGW